MKTQSEKEPAGRLTRGTLSRDDSLALKGVAILMMLWHHCFLYGRFEAGSINAWPFSADRLMQVADYFGTCVCVFAFISGYGLYLSCRKCREDGGRTEHWIWDRLVRTLSGYWFVVAAAWIICGLLSGLPAQKYGLDVSPLRGLFNMAMDFFALNNFIGTTPMDGDWWYISTAVILVVLAPLLYLVLEKFGLLFTIAGWVILQRLGVNHLTGVSFLTYVPIFVFGMAFAKYGLPVAPARKEDLRSGRGVCRLGAWLVCALAGLAASFLLTFRLPNDSWLELKRSVLPLGLLFFCWMFLIRVPGVRSALIFLGRHSMNIWLTHQFIRGDYCSGLIYGMPHFLLSIIVLLAASIGISLVLELVKDKLRYQRLMDWLTALPDSVSQRLGES